MVQDAEDLVLIYLLFYSLSSFEQVTQYLQALALSTFLLS